LQFIASSRKIIAIPSKFAGEDKSLTIRRL
jgi:hypothetical protein